MLHVLFCDSAAGTLKQELRSRRINDRVVALTEWLDWGSISPDRIEDRLQWFEDNTEMDWDWLADCRHRFLTDVAADDDRLIWIAPRSAQEQCGLHWLLHQLQQAPGTMIVVDYPLGGAWRGEAPQSLGELPDDLMAQLFDDCPRQEWDESRFPLGRWRSLMDDGAALRIVENGAVTSARSDYFDPLILGRCPTQWTKWARVVSWTMVDAMDQGHRVGDIFLLWRLRELIEAGRIDCRGEFPSGADGSGRPAAELRRIV